MAAPVLVSPNVTYERSKHLEHILYVVEIEYAPH